MNNLKFTSIDARITLADEINKQVIKPIFVDISTHLKSIREQYGAQQTVQVRAELIKEVNMK